MYNEGEQTERSPFRAIAWRAARAVVFAWDPTEFVKWPCIAARNAPDYNISGMALISARRVPRLPQRSRQRFRQSGLLLRKHGAQINHQAIILDPCNHRRRARPAAKALLHLRR